MSDGPSGGVTGRGQALRVDCGFSLLFWMDWWLPELTIWGFFILPVDGCAVAVLYARILWEQVIRIKEIHRKRGRDKMERLLTSFD